MNRPQIVRFIAVVLAASWAAQFLILKAFGTLDNPAAKPFGLIVMFLPGVVGFLFSFRYSTVRRDVRWRPKNVLPLALALIIPLSIAFATLAIVQISGIGQSSYFMFSIQNVDIASGPWLLGLGDQSWLRFAANVLLTGTVFALLSGCVALGEEYGWRGVLQPAMIRELGYRKGVALLGIVWAAWHCPIILAGYNYPNTPVLGALLFLPLLLVGASFIMAWLTVRNGSLWPAVIMHGAINSVYDGIVTRIDLNAAGDYALPLIEIGLFVAIAGSLTVAAMPKDSRHGKRVPPHPTSTRSDNRALT